MLNVEGGPRPASPGVAGCSLCGTSMAPDAPRCPACGMYVTVEPDGNVVASRPVWALVGGFVVVYLLTLLVVFLAR
jgi:hypothetical protein